MINQTGQGSGERRLPGLDGLRAIAAFGVVLVHSSGMAGFPESAALKWSVTLLGNNAVPLFFVLSGYLITHLLLREEAANGRVSLKNFYARRALRILPASLCYLAVLAVLNPLLGLLVKGKEFLAAIFWYRNFLYDGWSAWKFKLDGGEYFTGHFWSLSVEEHFYFVWPLLFLLAPGRFRVWILSVPALVLLPIWRTYNMKISGIGGMNYWRTDLVCDYLVLGALLAVLEGRWSAVDGWRRFWGSAWVPVGAFIGVLFTRMLGGLGMLVPALKQKAVIGGAVLGTTTSALGLVLLVGLAVHGRRAWLDRFLNARVMVWVGTVSYSLYLWQQIFCDEFSRVLPLAFPLNLLPAFAAATVSYYVLERPLLRLRAKFRPKH